jgi:hypothetical protein
VDTLLDPWYVTGFAEAAGSFTYSRSGRQLMLVFAVRMPRANLKILEQLKVFFGGAGRVYSREACSFRVTRPAELLRVVEHFDRHPLHGARREAYRIWREMVFLRATHHGTAPPERLGKLAKALSARRA